MPKIAAALAVFLTVVTCIGYNTARYPAVWEMVALSDGFTRSRRSEPPAPFPESADSPQSEALATAASPGESAPRWQSDWSSREESETASESSAARPSPAYARHHNGSSSHTEDDSSRANASSSDANEHSGYPYDGSSGGSEDREPPRAEDGDAEKDKPADRVASGQKQKGAPKGARNDAQGSQFAVDPVAPLQGSTPSGREDEHSGAGASDVAGESRGDTQGSSAARTAADSTGSTDPAPEGSAGESTAVAAAGSTLVPIQPAGPDGHGCEPPGGASPDGALVAVDSGDSTSTRRVERLPPVDQVATLPGARPLGPHDALPVYPSTGVE